MLGDADRGNIVLLFNENQIEDRMYFTESSLVYPIEIKVLTNLSSPGLDIFQSFQYDFSDVSMINKEIALEFGSSFFNSNVLDVYSSAPEFFNGDIHMPEVCQYYIKGAGQKNNQQVSFKYPPYLINLIIIILRNIYLHFSILLLFFSPIQFI
jgi:hypothetical protein